MSDELEKLPTARPMRINKNMQRWMVSRAVNKFVAQHPSLAGPEYKPRIQRYIRMSILLSRFLKLVENDDFQLLNDKNEIRESFDLIRRMSDSVAKLEKDLYRPIPRVERQAKSLDTLRAEADAEEVEVEDEGEI